MAIALSVSGLAKTYRAEGVDVLALRGIELELETGELLSVMGPSGCGKSTFLNLLGGLDRPSAGVIELGGRSMHGLSETDWAIARRREIGFVFQFFNLLGTLTVAENVELPALLVGTPPRDARARRSELLERLGVADRADTLPSRLSGGQQQRVALARALVNRPRVLLADEPTGNLDSESAREVTTLLRELRREGQTVLLVTHDARVAACADRVVTMRDGLIADDVTLEGDDAPRGIADELLRLEG